MSAGQPCVVGSLRPIVVAAGDNVVLPCHLEPPQNVEDEVVEWSRQEHGPVQYVHVHRDHGEVTDMKAASYHSRTALFPEELKHGNISLKITGVTPADEGSYRCFVPTLSSPAKSSTVRLTVSECVPVAPPQPAGDGGRFSGGDSCALWSGDAAVDPASGRWRASVLVVMSALFSF